MPAPASRRRRGRYAWNDGVACAVRGAQCAYAHTHGDVNESHASVRRPSSSVVRRRPSSSSATLGDVARRGRAVEVERARRGRGPSVRVYTLLMYHTPHHTRHRQRCARGSIAQALVRDRLTRSRTRRRRRRRRRVRGRATCDDVQRVTTSEDATKRASRV